MKLTDKLRLQIAKAFDPRRVDARNLSFFSTWYPPNEPQPDQPALTETDLRNPVIFRCIDVPGADAASVPLQLRRWTNRDKGEFEVEADPAHALRHVFDHVNDAETPTIFWQQFFADLRVEGNAFIAPVVVGGVPIELRRLPPGEVFIAPDPSKKKVIGGYIWDPTGMGRGPVIPADQIWHTRLRNPMSNSRGMGLLSRLRWYIRLEDVQDDWNWNRYKQGFPTQVIVAYRGKFQPGDRERLEEDLNSKYSGPQGKRYMVVEGDTLGNQQFDFKDFPRPTNDEIGYIEEKKDKRNVYAMTFGVTPSKLGDYSESHLANAEQQTADYWRDTIKNGLHAVAAESLNSNFMPKFWPQDPDLFWAYDYSHVDALQMSAATKSEIAERNVRNGIWTPNEAREYQGREKDPDPAMDRHYVNGILLGERAPNLVPPVIRSVEDATKVVSLEVARLKTKLQKSGELLNLDDERERFKAKVRAKIRRMVEQAADEFLDLSGVAIAFNVETPAVIEMIGQRVMMVTEAVVTNTNEMIRAAIADAYSEGLTGLDLRARIEQAFEERREDWQLKRIADTEIHAAQEGAGYQAAHQAQIEMKRWLTARDSKVRGLDPREDADHDGIEAAGAIPLDSPFQDPRNHDSMMYPGDNGMGALPRSTVNCRCSWIADFSGKFEIDLDAAWYRKNATRDKFTTDMERTIAAFLRQMESRALAEFDRQQEAPNAAQP